MGMVRDCHPDHDWHQLFCGPQLVGWNATARWRTWCIGAHREHSTILHDPFQLSEMIENHMQGLVQLSVEDYLVASKDEIWAEAAALAGKRGVISFSKDNTNLTQVLRTRELETVKELDRKYYYKFGKEAASNRCLAYFLGDSAAYCSWSAVSQRLPTYRMNSRCGLYWLPAHGRWLTSKEKLLSMGFPVTHEQCRALRCQSLGSRDMDRTSDVLGNCFHFQVAGVMQMVALSCFGPKEN